MLQGTVTTTHRQPLSFPLQPCSFLGFVHAFCTSENGNLYSTEELLNLQLCHITC